MRKDQPMAYADYGSIIIRGARQNNLKNVSLDIPKRRITVFTGGSGSGKSSLVFSTTAAESQRLINETYPDFVQQFMPHYGQPGADMLENISAAIIADPQRVGGNLRSTVATVTDTAQMLRVLFSRLGKPRLPAPGYYSYHDPRGTCPDCEGSARWRLWIWPRWWTRASRSTRGAAQAGYDRHRRPCGGHGSLGRQQRRRSGLRGRFRRAFDLGYTDRQPHEKAPTDQGQGA
jgi:excinuclease UvrABC ATPase subunit